MNEKFILKPMDTNSLDDVLRLLGRESSLEMKKYYIWKYEETPANQLGVVIDSDSSRVIGFNALVRSWFLRTPGNSHSCDGHIPTEVKQLLH
jgi:hypothetical protein